MEEARARVRYALVFRDQPLGMRARTLIAEGLDVARQLGDRRWEARATRQLAIVIRNDGDAGTAVTTLSECLDIFAELEDRRGQAVTLRNRGDAYRLDGNLDDAAADLTAALRAFQDIGDRRWEARTRASIAGLCRLRKQWADASQHLESARAAFVAIIDRHGEAGALRETGLLLRDQGDLDEAALALDASQEIFGELGGELWTARVLASKSVLEGLRGRDAAPLAREAADICRDAGAGVFDTSAGGGPQWGQIGILSFDGQPRPDCPTFDPKSGYAGRFRTNTTINTLTVLGPFRKLPDLVEPRGPDSNQVRVLVADARERRRRRKNVHRWNKRVLRAAKRIAAKEHADRLPTSAGS